MDRSQIESYISNIGGGPSLLERVMVVKEIADQICPEEIIQLFISEKPRKNGDLQPDSLWFFSTKYMLESKKILSSNINIDITSHYQYITRYEMTAINYDFSTFNDESILKIDGLIEGTFFEMFATRNNCEILWEIIRTFIIPNIWEYEITENEESETEVET